MKRISTLNSFHKKFLSSSARLGLLLLTSLFLPNTTLAQSQATPARLQVVTTLPEFTEMAKTIGGEAVDVTSLLRGIEDPHRVDGTPAMVLKLAKADLVVLTGMGLETSWLARALSKTGKASIQRGGPGYVELGSFIQPLEKPLGPIDRSHGDVHSEGNPHFNLSPKALAESATGLTQALVRARPNRRAEFESGEARFKAEMAAVEADVRSLLKPILALHPKPWFIEYHREFVYFFDLYGLSSMGAIEEKPGISPSSGRLAQVSMMAKAKNVRRALAGTFAPRQHLRRFSELSGIPFSIVPTMVRPSETDAATIRAMQLTIANELAKN